MALLSEQDRQTLRTHLAEIADPVTLLFFTQTIGGPETALIAKQILDEVAGLSDRVSIEEVNFILEKDRAAALGITAVPAIAVLKRRCRHAHPISRRPGRLRVHVVDRSNHPGGRQRLGPLPREQEADRGARGGAARHQGLRHADVPALPPGGHACAPDGIRASADPRDVHRSNQFMDLSRQYRVTGVPKTVVNGTIEILGAVPEETFVRTVLQQPTDAPDADRQETPAT